MNRHSRISRKKRIIWNCGKKYKLSNYFTILQAIAHGNMRSNVLAQASGVGDARTVFKYLSVLEPVALNLAAVTVPIFHRLETGTPSEAGYSHAAPDKRFGAKYVSTVSELWLSNRRHFDRWSDSVRISHSQF